MKNIIKHAYIRYFMEQTKKFPNAFKFWVDITKNNLHLPEWKKQYDEIIKYYVNKK